MANTKINTDAVGVTVWYAPAGTFANPAKPTVAEFAAAIDVSQAMLWDSYGFGVQASDQNAQPSFGDVGNPQTRGLANWGGAISFFYPAKYSPVDATDKQQATFLALKNPGTTGYLIIRADGKKSAATTGIIANDMVDVFSVITDGWDDAVEGAANFSYAVTFQPTGAYYPDAVVATTVAVSTPVAVGTANYASPSGKTPLTASVNSRVLASATGVYVGTPFRFTWASSNPTAGTVDSNGVFQALSAGTTNVTATDKITGTVSSALAITTT